MRFIAVAAFALTSYGALGATWYVDARVGSDVNDGGSATHVGSSGPFRSLARVAASVRPGDTVLLACASVWNETLHLRGGTPAAPIVVSAAAECQDLQRPAIDPRLPLPVTANDEWSDTGISVDVVGRVFSGDQELPPAVAGGSPWLTLPMQPKSQGEAAEISLPPNFLADSNVLKGAIIALRTVPYRVERRRIAAVLTDGRIRLDSPTQYPVKTATPFFIEQLARPGLRGWASGPRASLLIRPNEPSANKPLHWVRKQPSLLSDGTLRLQGITIRNAGEDALRVVRGAGSIIKDIVITSALRDGISLVASEGSSISGTRILNVGRDAVRLDKSDHSAVLANEIQGVGMEALPVDTFAAINSETSSSVRIRGNRLRNVAYIGIRFKRDSVVEENLLDGVCARLADCGAIHGWARLDPSPVFNSRIVRNIIRNVGTGEPWDVIGNPVAAGIYLDDLSSGITVEDNVIESAPNGIFLHNSTQNVVRNNQVLRVQDCAICLVGGISFDVATAMGSNRFEKNTLLPLPGGVGYRMFSRYGVPDWRQMVNDRIYYYEHSPAIIAEGSEKLAQLLGRNSAHADSLVTEKLVTLTPYSIALAGGAKTIDATGRFGASGEDARLSSCASGKADCTHFTVNGSGQGRLYSGEYQPTGKSKLAMAFAISGSAAGGSLKIEIRSSVAPYEVFTELGRVRPGNGFVTILPVPDIPLRRPWRIHLVADGPASLDVSGFHVVDHASPELSIRTAVNTTAELKRIPCADLGLSSCGNGSYPGDNKAYIELAPFSATIVQKSLSK